MPFHFYAPDVYQGTSAGAAALLAFMPKVAGFVGSRFGLLGLVGPHGDRTGAGGRLPGAAFVVDPGRGHDDARQRAGAVARQPAADPRLFERRPRRLHAHRPDAAPVLAAQPGAPGGVAAVLFYLVAYGGDDARGLRRDRALEFAGRRVETVDDLAGLSRTHPGLALTMTALLFSLIGMPLTAGFAGKLMLLFGAVEVPQQLYVWLAVIMVLNAAVGAYYYLRIVGVMYLRGALSRSIGRTASPAESRSPSACSPR